ncbi:CbaC protein [Natrinema saccharevitans]|uniref:CbaC protein n=1 Tax=Natrinema saccharevitans TaxID=301967 RepID=A0A1S8AUY4_9EURY|nr:CbaC protein [Natrinema saccharevitans]OLZ40475.1 CbaC protein [Natrinema saccharevitans]
MHTSPAKLLILIALSLVILVEGRTVLAFFGVNIPPLETALVGLVIIVVLIVWAIRPIRGAPWRRSDEDTGEDTNA